MVHHSIILKVYLKAISLSPYLFCITMNSLSQLLKDNISSPSIPQFLWKNIPTYRTFEAEDVQIFGTKILHSFQSSSNHSINLTKSFIWNSKQTLYPQLLCKVSSDCPCLKRNHPLSLKSTKTPQKHEQLNNKKRPKTLRRQIEERKTRKKTKTRWRNGNFNSYRILNPRFTFVLLKFPD